MTTYVARCEILEDGDEIDIPENARNVSIEHLSDGISQPAVVEITFLEKQQESIHG